MIGVNKQGQAWYRTGISKALPEGSGWHELKTDENVKKGITKNVNVAMCASGASWVVLYGKHKNSKGANHHSLKYSPKATSRTTIPGQQWQHYTERNGALSQISCGFRDQVWGLSNHHVYYLQGVDASRHMGTTFFKVADAPAKHKWISVGLKKNEVWSVALDGGVYRRTGFSTKKPMGTAWSHIESKTNLKQISVGNCQVFGVTKMHKIFKRTGCSAATPEGSSWEEFPGTLRHIAVGQGPVLWGVDYVHQVWFQQLGDLINEEGEEQDKYWDHVPSPEKWGEIKEGGSDSSPYSAQPGFFYVDVGRDGHVWALSGQKA